MITHFNNFDQINISLFESYIKENKSNDIILTVDFGMIPDVKLENDEYLSGSYAIFLLMKQIPTAVPLFGPSDIDIVILNKEWKVIKTENFDKVYTSLKNIEELFKGSDLPTCKIAINNKGTYYFTAQCLISISKNICYLPIYMKSYQTLYDKISKYPTRKSAEIMADKIMKRIEKYNKRGFKYVFVDDIDPQFISFY